MDKYERLIRKWQKKLHNADVEATVLHELLHLTVSPLKQMKEITLAELAPNQKELYNKTWGTHAERRETDDHRIRF